MSVRYAVIFEQAERNWAAYVPDLPGCITTGSTLEETERNIREAIEGHLKTLREFGDPIPHPTTVARDVEIQPAAYGRAHFPVTAFRPVTARHTARTLGPVGLQR